MVSWGSCARPCVTPPSLLTPSAKPGSCLLAFASPQGALFPPDGVPTCLETHATRHQGCALARPFMLQAAFYPALLKALTMPYLLSRCSADPRNGQVSWGHWGALCGRPARPHHACSAGPGPRGGRGGCCCRRQVASCMASEGPQVACVMDIVVMCIALGNACVMRCCSRLSSQESHPPAPISHTSCCLTHVCTALAHAGAEDALTSIRAADAAALARMQAFCTWLSRLLVACLYPGAPYERKFFAIEVGGQGVQRTVLQNLQILQILFANGCLHRRAWVSIPQTAAVPIPHAQVMNSVLEVWPPSTAPTAGAAAVPLWPYCPNFLGPRVVQLLLANAVDSWDKLRGVSLRPSLFLLSHPLGNHEMPLGRRLHCCGAGGKSAGRAQGRAKLGTQMSQDPALGLNPLPRRARRLRCCASPPPCPASPRQQTSCLWSPGRTAWHGALA